MKNSIYQSLSDSDKEKIQNNIKDYPCSGGILYNELNSNYFVTRINVSALLDLSGVLKIHNLSELVNYLFEVTQLKNNN
jgi:hypothetical protein